MGFRARVYIQGVGLIRRSDDEKSLEGYFPTSHAQREFDFSVLTGNTPNPSPRTTPICEHHYFAQFSAQCLGQVEDVWLTVMLDRTDVVVQASGPLVEKFSVVGKNGHIEGLAYLGDLLERGVDPRKLRSEIQDDRAALLDGTLRLDRGRVRGVSTREWELGGSKVRMSGLVLVDLGEVEDLVLRFSSFDHNETRILRLFPKITTKDVDLWIRHYCDLSRPDLNPPTTLPLGYTDWDFLLNYTLLEDLRNKRAKEKAKLPVPMIKDGGQIGGNHTICQGTG